MYGGGQQLNDIRNPRKEASEVRIQPKWPNPVWVSLEIFLEAKSRNTDCKHSFVFLTFFFSFICWKQPQLDGFHPTTCSTFLLCCVFCGKARKGKSNGRRENNMDTWSWFSLSARGRRVLNGHIQSYWELPREGHWHRNWICTCFILWETRAPRGNPRGVHANSLTPPGHSSDAWLACHYSISLDETGQTITDGTWNVGGFFPTEPPRRVFLSTRNAFLNVISFASNWIMHAILLSGLPVWIKTEYRLGTCKFCHFLFLCLL